MIFRKRKRMDRYQSPGRHAGEVRRKRFSRLLSRAPQIESLEDRRLLAVVWVNRGTAATDTDSFNVTYGANAAVARQLVDRAVSDWSAVINDFNFDSDNDPTTNNVYQLTVNAADLGGNLRGQATIDNISGGLPTDATITMDDAGGSGGWFLDATPNDDDEFTQIVNPFQADSAETGNDFYRTILHEIGHAVGIASNGALALAGFLTPAGVDQNDNTNPALNTFQNLAGQFGVLATLTDNGGRHIYEGAVDPGFPGAPTHPNDLMNPGRTVGPPATRQLITDLDAMIIADAFGYTVTLPSTLNVFIGADSSEPNNTLATATNVGSPETSTFSDLSIFDAGDEDFFRVAAHSTGKLVINASFLHASGDLDMQVLDENGNVIATADSIDDNEQIVIPVVSQESYVVRVFGISGDINNYSLEIENFPAPTPVKVDLKAGSDSGMREDDDVTNDQTPTIEVLVDSVFFPSDVTAGSDLLTSDQVVAGTTPGFGVALTIVDTDTGEVVGGDVVYADPLGPLSPLWRFTPDAPLDAGTYMITSAMYVVDGQDSSVSGPGTFSEPLLLVIDPTAPNQPGTPDMLAISDSGMFNDDNVTNINAVAIAGIDVEPNAKVRVFAGGLLVGQSVTTTEGEYEITTEPLTDGVYEITIELEDLAGNISELSDPLTIEIDTIEPNTSYLDLVEASDSGRNDDDNITNDNTPTVTMTTSDANVTLHEMLFTDYLKFRIYDRFEGSDEVLIYDSANDTAVDDVSTAGDGFTSLTFVTTTLSQLDDGIHNLKLEAEDRAGNISHDFLLNLLIDTQAYQGDVELHPESDSGVSGYTATMSDRITADNVPDFFGVAEANNIVTVAIDGVPAGTTVAVPLDGDDAFQPANAPNTNVEGNWRVATNLNLGDGEHSAVVTFEDLAGNRVSTEPVLFIVDTQGPRITGVEVNEPGQPYDLFAPKPTVDGPTPAVNALVISVSDLPNRTDEFLYDPVYAALATDPGHYLLVGDTSGIIPIASIDYDTTVVAGQPALGAITLNFDEPLPDDRFTLTVSDSLSDVAGNALDGESNTTQPQAGVSLPTGDGVPGGDFIARFTVDSRPEIATWSQGVAYADINGNFVWDPEGQDNDFTNRDFVFNFGEITDGYFTGNFAQNALPGFDGILGTPDDVPISPDDATSSGFDKIGAYGVFNGVYQFLLDTNDDGVGDLVPSMAFQVNAIPVAGNFFNSSADQAAVANGQRPRDEIGAFDGSAWYFDVDGNNQIDADERFPTALRGNPIVGDFNGDGVDDLGVYNNDTGVFTFDLVSSYNAAGPIIVAQDQLTFGFSGFGDVPVVGDVNLDGVDDIVMWVPGRNGQLPKDSGEFHFLVSDNVSDDPVATDLPSDVFGPFSPAPLGNDLIAAFGDDFALPLIGNFDPPIETNSGGASFVASLTNLLNPLDTTGDGFVTARDALVVINALGRGESINTSNPLRAVASWGGFQLDASQDGAISALDALHVINGLARLSLEGEQVTDQAAGQAAGQADWAVAADGAIAGFADDEDDLLGLLALDAEQQRVKA